MEHLRTDASFPGCSVLVILLAGVLTLSEFMPVLPRKVIIFTLNFIYID